MPVLKVNIIIWSVYGLFCSHLFEVVCTFKQWYNYYYGILSGTVSSITDISMPSSKCGQAATHNLPKGVGLSFFCRPSLKGRYVTIRDVRRGSYPAGFVLCELEVYSEQRGMAYLDILIIYY